MGVAASCIRIRDDAEKDLLLAIGEGDINHVKLLLTSKPKLINSVTTSLPPLHHAASLGQPEVLSLLLENGAKVDALNHRKQTALMLACKNGRAACIERLVEWGANVLIFDASHERTCIHYTAKSGHLQCLQIILSAAKSSSVAQTWGFARFVNVIDGTGATPLHLAAMSSHPAVVRLLLSNGALVSATTTKTGKNSLALASTPLHFAAQGGSTECIKELLAWGADRLQRNSQGHTPFYIATKHRNMACAALLNPLTSEPLVWPSPWKFMNNLDPEAKVLLETALAQANDAWEKQILSSSGVYEVVSDDLQVHMNEDDDDEDEVEMCCICFERACTIEVRDCGHQMCASCTLALCCHNKPNPSVQSSPSPACPFCRQNIEHLKLAKPIQIVTEEEADKEEDKQQMVEKLIPTSRSKKPVDAGSSGSLKGLVSKGSFRLLSSARGSNRVADINWQKESSSEEDALCSAEICVT